MTEEKKPNLRDRLSKKTQVGVGPAGGVLPPAGMGSPGDVLPGFVPDAAVDAGPSPEQLAAQRAAAERARAAAEDPFASAPATAATPRNDIAFRMDDKPVSDSEVGRGRGGLFLAIGATALVSLLGGYAIGSLMADNAQKHATESAVNTVRGQLTTSGDTITALKQRVDRAADKANVHTGEGDAPAAAHPPDVDPDLITWFQSQPPEPPFSAEAFAGRAGRLKGDAVGKLVLLSLQLNQAWSLLQQHARRTNLVTTRAALAAAAPGSDTGNRMLVTFAPQGTNGIFAQLVTLAGPPANGQVTLAGPGVAPNSNRALYQTGDLTLAQLPTVAVRVQGHYGLASQMEQSLAGPWIEYVGRLTAIKQLSDALSQSYQQANDALAPAAAH